MLVRFSLWKNSLATYIPSCSAYSPILEDSKILDLASTWIPKQEAYSCVCLSRPHLVTPNLLTENKLDTNLCENLAKESTDLVYVRYLESICFSILSFLLDFAFVFMSKFEA